VRPSEPGTSLQQSRNSKARYNHCYRSANSAAWRSVRTLRCDRCTGPTRRRLGSVRRPLSPVRRHPRPIATPPGRRIAICKPPSLPNQIRLDDFQSAQLRAKAPLRVITWTVPTSSALRITGLCSCLSRDAENRKDCVGGEGGRNGGAGEPTREKTSKGKLVDVASADGLAGGLVDDAGSAAGGLAF